jgi:hypothetical protein
MTNKMNKQLGMKKKVAHHLNLEHGAYMKEMVGLGD